MMKFLEIDARTMRIMKIKLFYARITKIMNFQEFHARITKIMKNFDIQNQNHRSHETLRTSCQNNENH